MIIILIIIIVVDGVDGGVCGIGVVGALMLLLLALLLIIYPEMLTFEISIKLCPLRGGGLSPKCLYCSEKGDTAVQHRS
jgi:hypothetical protein